MSQADMALNAPAIPNVAAPVVCIAGMQRSGTSTIAQLLYRTGLDLGREKDLFAGNAPNPDGYWENKHFVEVNEGILREYGGGWDMPTVLEPDWQQENRVRPYREKAERLIKAFEGHSPWGWKDPRNSLTLPFWLELLPKMKVVVCLRDPMEVAFSIRKRGASSIALGLHLWKVYNQALLETLAEDQYVVTHYEAYFYRPQVELRHVLDFVKVPASDQLISVVRSRVVRGLRHHYATAEELREHDPSGELSHLYSVLCEKARWDPDPTVSPTEYATGERA